MKLKLSEWLLCFAVCILAVTVMFSEMASVQCAGVSVAVLGLLGESVVRRRRRRLAARSATASPLAVEAGWPTGMLLAPLLLWFVWTTMFQVGAGLSEASVSAWLVRVAFPLIGFFAFYRAAMIW